MLKRFTKIQRFTFLIVITTLFSCSKTASETGAGKVAGLYRGTMNVITYGAPSNAEYGTYVVKVEHKSKESIRVSCVTLPAAFEAYNITVIYANGTVNCDDQNTRLFYQTTTNQMMLNVSGGNKTASFIGYKQ
jgi:hypothetical protein